MAAAIPAATASAAAAISRHRRLTAGRLCPPATPVAVHDPLVEREELVEIQAVAEGSVGQLLESLPLTQPAAIGWTCLEIASKRRRGISRNPLRRVARTNI